MARAPGMAPSKTINTKQMNMKVSAAHTSAVRPHANMRTNVVSMSAAGNNDASISISKPSSTQVSSIAQKAPTAAQPADYVTTFNKYTDIAFGSKNNGFQAGSASQLHMNKTGPYSHLIETPMKTRSAMKIERFDNDPVFNIEGEKDFSAVVMDNFQIVAGSQVRKAAKRFTSSVYNLGARSIIGGSNRYARCSVAMAAVSDSAQGSWGDVNRKYVIGGNWKSNGDKKFIKNFNKDVVSDDVFDPSEIDVAVAPPSLYLTTAQTFIADGINVMSQDCSQYAAGAYTGNITADMLKDVGISWTLTGHSERRTLFHETDEDVAIKTKNAIESGLSVMLCIGEQLEERESGKTGEVNARQLKAVVEKLSEEDWAKVVIAYEPVWAIGTGKVATKEQAQETHSEIRDWLAANVSEAVAGQTRILYGGSVNGGNCGELIGQRDIDGFLVGGASLKPEFKEIVETAYKHGMDKK